MSRVTFLPSFSVQPPTAHCCYYPSTQRSPQSPTPPISPSQTPEPRSPLHKSLPPANVSATAHIPPPLKRPRSPFRDHPVLPPRKMSRFQSNDGWSTHVQDRVVLPPLSTAVDNGLTPSRRTSIASPASYSQGSYAFTNYDQQRPPTASSTMGSPSMASRMDAMSVGDQAPTSHGPHPYRRPSMVGRSQSAMVPRGAPTSPMVQDPPRLTTSYSDPSSNPAAAMWNIPPPPPPQSQPERGAYPYEYPPQTEYNVPANGDGTPQSPSFAFASQGFTASQANMYTVHRQQQQQQHHGMMSSNTSAPAPPAPAPMDTPPDDELAQLRTKVRELEFVNDLVQLRVVELENERAKLMTGGSDSKSSSGSSSGSSPSRSSTLLGGSDGTPPPSDPDFAGSWEKRTEARVKRFCSLNRAGNALCAWHDSRRERRAYPPRMAPPGTLNCGCTFEEALFEESLSRHKVGSYLPGETVRMDPALRNPLLSLLQWRYGYKDGDFERDPASGRWVEGEGAGVWQHKPVGGATGAARRKHSDTEP